MANIIVVQFMLLICGALADVCPAAPGFSVSEGRVSNCIEGNNSTEPSVEACIAWATQFASTNAFTWDNGHCCVVVTADQNPSSWQAKGGTCTYAAGECNNHFQCQTLAGKLDSYCATDHTCREPCAECLILNNGIQGCASCQFPILTCGSHTSGNTAGAANVVGNPAGDAIFYFYTNSPSVRLSTCGSQFNTYLRIYSGGLVSQEHECDDCGDCGLQAVLDAQLNTQTLYYVVVEGYSSNEGAFVLDVTCGAPTLKKRSSANGEPEAAARTVSIAGGIAGSVVLIGVVFAGLRRRRKYAIIDTVQNDATYI